MTTDKIRGQRPGLVPLSAVFSVLQRSKSSALNRKCLKDISSYPNTVSQYNSHVLSVWILTVCLGMGGSPDGPVSASSLRMWSVLMYESYRPSPCRAEGGKERTNQISADVKTSDLLQKHC